jgi:ATP/ADP translocase
MTGGFVSAAIVAPLMLAAAGVVVFVLTGLFDRHDRADRKR